MPEAILVLPIWLKLLILGTSKDLCTNLEDKIVSDNKIKACHQEIICDYMWMHMNIWPTACLNIKAALNHYLLWREKKVSLLGTRLNKKHKLLLSSTDVCMAVLTLKIARTPVAQFKMIFWLCLEAIILTSLGPFFKFFNHIQTRLHVLRCKPYTSSMSFHLKEKLLRL